MAYVVGSASVEIVPDFRGAQVAITAWFAKQQNELTVPVRPEMNPETTRAIEKQAADTGNRVGKAMADGVERSVNRDLTAPISRQFAKLEADIEKAQVKEKEASDSLRLAQLRLNEAREAGNKSASQMLSLENAVEKAQNRVAEANRNGARASDALREAQRQADLSAQKSAEAAAAKAEQLAAREQAAREKAAAAQERESQRALAAQERLGAQMAKDIEREIAARQSAAEKAEALRRREEEKAEASRQRDLAAQKRADEKSLQQLMRSIQEEAQLRDRERDRVLREENLFAERSAKAIHDSIQNLFSEQERIRLQIEVDKEQAIREGRMAGGRVAQAVKEEWHQNAGLITAAVTGALVAGGPLITAAAVGLFAGVGAVGAFQSEKLRETWRATFGDIADKGIADSAVLIPAFDRMATSIGASFERMRPRIQNAFEALPVQIDIFSESLTNTAERALPGLVRAVEGGRPVMMGFGDLMESIGQGTSDFMDNITAHAPAAGQSLTSLGDGFGELLPLLGELLGEGAELGTIVLPVLSASLGGMRTVVESLGGSLPTLATGFLAFRTIQGTGRFVNQLSNGLLNAAPNIGVFTERLTGSAEAGTRVMSATGRAASAISRFGSALPAVGVAVGVVSALMADGKQEIDGYANALMKGGAAAAQARSELGDQSYWDRFQYNLVNWFNTEDVGTAKTREATEAIRKREAAMSPLELAQSRLAGWTETLAFRMGDESTSAEDVAIAQRKVAEYSQRAAEEQANLESKVRGVTDAMVAQADQARARVDSEYGYQQSILDVQDATIKAAEAQASLDKARKEGDPKDIAQAELDLKGALLDVNTALRDQATAAGEVAASNLPASMDDSQRAILGAKASLDELNAMMAMGIVLPPELEQWRQQLIQITDESNGAKLAQAQMAAALGEVGVAVTEIPNSRAIKIEAPTQEIIDRLRDLGFTVTEIPDGTVNVKADTEEAKGNLGELSSLMTTVTNTPVTPKPILNLDEFNVGVGLANGIIQDLDSKRPEPVLTLEPGPFNSTYDIATGQVRDLDGKRPEPILDMNVNPFTGAFEYADGAQGILNGRRPNPILSATDHATPVINGVQAGINGLRDKTVTLTVKQRVEGGGTVNSIVGPNADGGAVEDTLLMRRTFGYAGGGAVVGRGSAIEDLVPALGPNPFARYRIANGEHILDGLDVALMGGQAGVYAFRDMLKSRAFSKPSADTGIRSMVAASPTQRGAVAGSSTPPRAVHLYTPDIPAAVRELKAQEHRDEVLASPWS